MTRDDEPERLREATGADGVERVRDITLGSARPEEYSATDLAPVADASVADLLANLGSPEAHRRRRATLALAERDPGPDVLDALESRARTDPDAEVRQFAVEALAKLGGDPAVARALLESDADQWVRAEAAVALDRLDREGHEAYFEALLDDAVPAVRRNALISLTRIRGRAAREELLAAVEDENDRVREWAVKLLGTFEDDPAVEATLSKVAEDDAEVDVVRKTAARSLGATGADLESLFETDGETELAGDHMLNRVPDR